MFVPRTKSRTYSAIARRQADKDEKGKFDNSRAKAILEGKIREGESWMVYLVPVSDPTDDPELSDVVQP